VEQEPRKAASDTPASDTPAPAAVPERAPAAAPEPAGAHIGDLLDELESATAVEPAAAVVPAAQAAEPRPATRRRFLRYLLGFSVVSSLVMLAAPAVAFLVPPKPGTEGAGGKISAGTTADIPPGKGKVVPMGSKPVIVVNGENGVTAFSAICTHLGCIVAFDDTNAVIVCPCHDGRFNPATGAVVSGPPPAPLQAVTVSVENDEIFLVES
jgi:cytochrome b6-f complex iron-sulfur subunit